MQDISTDKFTVSIFKRFNNFVTNGRYCDVASRTLDDCYKFKKIGSSIEISSTKYTDSWEILCSPYHICGEDNFNKDIDFTRIIDILYNRLDSNYMFAEEYFG